MDDPWSRYMSKLDELEARKQDAADRRAFGKALLVVLLIAALVALAVWL